jgi:hypothetical protein
VKLANIGHRELRGGPMQRQGSFSQAEYANKKKQTRRDKFLAEMEAVVPWPRLAERLAPLYPKGERGRPPIPLERMLRIHFLQQWYAFCSNGTRWPTRRWKKRYTTVKRCGALPGLIWRWMRCRTRRRSSISGIGWSGTI